jgi:2-amino-4-hydroxy-6-hydroxymethyldihydropteridine diphosphokinase
MILIALGANLDHPRYGPPRNTCEAALGALTEHGLRIMARSRWYRSPPVPPSDQPWYINGIAQIETDLDPAALLALLHRVEEAFGRVRRARDEARVLDLDLLDYDGRVSAPGESPVLPHPRLAERAFVVLPLAEVAPDWRHPVTGANIDELAGRMAPESEVEPVD